MSGWSVRHALLGVVLAAGLMAAASATAIAPVGTIDEFALPAAASAPNAITAGPDGNLWFTEETGNAIGRITPGGVITEFPLPMAGSSPTSIAAAPTATSGSARWGGSDASPPPGRSPSSRSP